MRWAAAGLALWLGGCAPALGDCPRFVSDPTGERPLPIGAAGSDLRFELRAPLSVCVGDALSATVEVLDPHNRPVAATLDDLGVDLDTRARAFVSFLPEEGGDYLARVVFEPSLGVVQEFVHVAWPHSSSQKTATLVLPQPCEPTRAWPLADDALACERDGGVTLHFEDGATLAFPGSHLVVVGQTLWSLHDGGLERREWSDGGLVLTASVSGFAEVATPAVHDEAVAVRWLADGGLGLVRGTSGLTVQAVERARSALPEFFVPDDGPLPWRVSPQAPCTGDDVSCRTFKDDLRGVDPGALWVTGGFLRRPVLSPLVPQRIDWPLAAVALPPDAVERVPAFLAPEADVVLPRVMVSLDEGALRFDAFVEASLVRVGRRHALLEWSADGRVFLVLRWR